MDRGDALDLFDALLSRRAKGRIVAGVVAVVTVAGVVAPGLHLRDRVVRWVAEAYAEQVRKRLDDMLAAIVRQQPTTAPTPPVAR